MKLIKKNNAQIFLFINAFLWGSSYVWSKMLLGYLPRFTILFIGSLGGLLTTLIVYRQSIKGIPTHAIIPSIIVSVFSVLSNTFCMLALQNTGSSNTAFIVQTSVIMTPLIMAIVEKKTPEKRIISSAVIALIGLFLLTCDFESFRFSIGDLFAFGNALFFSLHLVGLNLNAKKVDNTHFTLIYYITNTVAFFAIMALLELNNIHIALHNLPIVGLLVAISAFVAIATVFIQNIAIRFTRPEKAVLIYTFEPLTTLVLGFILIGERMNGLKTGMGFIFILFSVIYSTYKWKPRHHKRQKEPFVRPVIDN